MPFSSSMIFISSRATTLIKCCDYFPKPNVRALAKKTRENWYPRGLTNIKLDFRIDAWKQICKVVWCPRNVYIFKSSEWLLQPPSLMTIIYSRKLRKRKKLKALKHECAQKSGKIICNTNIVTWFFMTTSTNWILQYTTKQNKSTLHVFYDFGPN